MKPLNGLPWDPTAWSSASLASSEELLLRHMPVDELLPEGMMSSAPSFAEKPVNHCRCSGEDDGSAIRAWPNAHQESLSPKLRRIGKRHF